jgi:hypothetical protein
MIINVYWICRCKNSNELMMCGWSRIVVESIKTKVELENRVNADATVIVRVKQPGKRIKVF